jgi:hypothetical protein
MVMMYSHHERAVHINNIAVELSTKVSSVTECNISLVYQLPYASWHNNSVI